VEKRACSWCSELTKTFFPFFSLSDLNRQIVSLTLLRIGFKSSFPADASKQDLTT